MRRIILWKTSCLSRASLLSPSNRQLKYHLRTMNPGICRVGKDPHDAAVVTTKDVGFKKGKALSLKGAAPRNEEQLKGSAVY